MILPVQGNVELGLHGSVHSGKGDERVIEQVVKTNGRPVTGIPDVNMSAAFIIQYLGM